MTEHTQNAIEQRRQTLQGVQRVVIKVGTRLLTDMDGISKDIRVNQLIEQIAKLRQKGIQVILVSSGAIGAGMTVMQTETRPSILPQLQAHAAIGQSRLMYLYETACVSHHFHCAQLLLTAADVKDRERHLNVINCLDALLSKGVLPIINENDSVSVDEIKFGDNDVLAALVANMIRADLTVLLTTVNGMSERRKTGEFGDRMPIIQHLTPEIREMASGTDGNRFSVGGMATKLKAADLVTKAGEALWIADGRDFGTLEKIFNGEDVGTLLLPTSQRKMTGHKRYLAFFSKHNGELTIDKGAQNALIHDGSSLLASGILEAHGSFDRGETVRIVSPEGTEIARGMCNYNRDDLDRIKGLQTNQLGDILGYEPYDAVVHRDHLVVTSREA